MKDRGDFRAIYCALIDDADFVQLPPNAKLVFFTLKLMLGYTGIGPYFASAIAERSGLEPKQVEDSIRILSEYRWISIERNIVWIVNGLKHDPTMNWNNTNHIKGVINQVIRLPRLAIAREFIEKYDLLAVCERRHDDKHFGILSEYYTKTIAIPSEDHPKTWDEDEDTDMDEGKKNVSNTSTLPIPNAFAFVPPTEAEVVEYGTGMLCVGEELCRRFYLHYGARGWLAKGDAIKDWRVLLQSWKQNEHKYEDKSDGTGKRTGSGKRVFRCPDAESDREDRERYNSTI